MSVVEIPYMSEIATIPSPTITIFWRWTWFAGLGLPSTGSPYRSPSSTGMAETEQCEQCEQCESMIQALTTEHGSHSNFKKIKSLVLLGLILHDL